MAFMMSSISYKKKDKKKEGVGSETSAVTDTFLPVTETTVIKFFLECLNT